MARKQNSSYKRPYLQVMDSICKIVDSHRSSKTKTIEFEYFTFKLNEKATTLPRIEITNGIKGTFLQGILPPISTISLLQLSIYLAKYSKNNTEEINSYQAESFFMQSVFKLKSPFVLEDTFFPKFVAQEEKIFNEVFQFKLNDTFLVGLMSDNCTNNIGSNCNLNHVCSSNEFDKLENQKQLKIEIAKSNESTFSTRLQHFTEMIASLTHIHRSKSGSSPKGEPSKKNGQWKINLKRLMTKLYKYHLDSL